jgi:hypothetical protein
MEIEDDLVGDASLAPTAPQAAASRPRGDAPEAAAPPRGTMQSTLGDLWGDVTEMVTGVSQELGTRPPGGLWRGRRKAALGLVMIGVAIALMLLPGGRRRAPAPAAGGAARCGCAGAGACG